jgi:hypothetical protein
MMADMVSSRMWSVELEASCIKPSALTILSRSQQPSIINLEYIAHLYLSRLVIRDRAEEILPCSRCPRDASHDISLVVGDTFSVFVFSLHNADWPGRDSLFSFFFLTTLLIASWEKCLGQRTRIWPSIEYGQVARTTSMKVKDKDTMLIIVL